MTNKNQEPLTHHEELRYSYLLKNLHYLNEREKLEFNYLLQKKMRQSKLLLGKLVKNLIPHHKRNQLFLSIPILRLGDRKMSGILKLLLM